jgi:hypothetical protein
MMIGISGNWFSGLRAGKAKGRAIGGGSCMRNFLPQSNDVALVRFGAAIHDTVLRVKFREELQSGQFSLTKTISCNKPFLYPRPICGAARLKFRKRSQLLIRTHDETLSIVAMCVSNPDRSPVGING